ncbi:MAG TPA: acetoin utilization protein AcuC [Burkholderiales bacterium]|nr:acetoin utilization protein AcuC [Burkholderiales bacterium]
MRRELLRRMAAGMLATGTATMLMSRQAHGVTGARATLYVGEELARYGFPDGHPLGADRQGAFYREAAAQGLLEKVTVQTPRLATREEIERFHSKRHVETVMHAERDRLEYLDSGDTPVFPGVYRASATVVGSALNGLARIMADDCTRTFQPIGGLHHAGRDHAAGFCVFNDLGVVIETLRSRYGIRRVAYVDIDVHHGDGIFYAFEDDPDLIFADIHEDGKHLFPGTGREDETGKGSAKGTKLNIPLAPRCGDREFVQAWPRVAAHLSKFEPEFVVFQCGADGLKGDPLAHLEYSPAAHAHAARSLVQLATRFSKGRLMAFGGGGYDRSNLARAWSAVLREIA